MNIPDQGFATVCCTDVVLIDHFCRMVLQQLFESWYNMPVTDTQIRALSACEKRIRRSDGGGLFLEVLPSGKKVFRLAYRLNGDQRTKMIGGYHRRSRVETKMHCVKPMGQSLMARDLERQVAVVRIRIAILNSYTAIGIPITETVAWVRLGEGEARTSTNSYDKVNNFNGLCGNRQQALIERRHRSEDVI